MVCGGGGGRSGFENGDRNGLQFMVMVKGRVSDGSKSLRVLQICK